MSVLTRTDFAGTADPDGFRGLTLEAMACHHRQERLDVIREAGASVAESWLDFGIRNEVGPIVAHALLEVFGTEISNHQTCTDILDRSERRMNILMDQLDEVAERLAPEGIRMIGLKNAGIARGLFPERALCPMGDLDVLVSRERYVEAHHLIVENGFTLDTRGTVESGDLEEGLLSGGTEYRKMVGDEEVWFELQWRPVAGRWIRSDQEPDGAELIARSVPIDGSQVRLLAPADNMIQVALHTAKHTYVRAPGLRLHTDVDRLTRYQTPDWGQVELMADTLEIRTAVYFSLVMARALLGTPVPERTLEHLAPERWRMEVISRWLRRVDIFEPNTRKFSRPAIMAFVAMLYDTPRGLLASVLDTEPDKLGARHLPRNLVRGTRRLVDIATRYQA